MSKKRSRITLIFLFFLVVIISVLVYGGIKVSNYLNKFSQGKDIVKADKVENDSVPINILLMGVDIGDGVKSKSNNNRTDTIMLLNYKYKENKVNIISIPRDTLIQVNGKNEKINAAHAIGGVPWVIESVEQLLSVNVNYYAKVDYQGFRALIDAIGGVDIKINNTMDYDDPAQDLHIHFQEGEKVHLDGHKAEEFFRWRKNNDGTGLAMGDLGRIQNQHLLIDKIFQKVTSASILPRIPEILEILPEYIETNMDGSDILKYGFSLKNLNNQDIKIETLQGDLEYIDGISYFIYDEKKNKNIAAILK